MSHLFKSRLGVSGLEYMALVVFLITGIILGGPYVMRAINAPFKAMEEGGIDAQREDIKQSSVNNAPRPECECSGLQQQGCGDGNVCDRTEALYRQTCLPLGCEVDLIAAGVIIEMEKCLPDPTNTCCDKAVSTGSCGVLALNVPGGCGAGKMEIKAMCGSPVPVAKYTCVDDNACVYDCQPFGPYAQGWCDPENYNKDIAWLTPVRYVNNTDCLVDSDMKCKAQCSPGMLAVPGGCNIDCDYVADSFFEDTSAGAGGQISFESPFYNGAPVLFDVDLWTEDLNYEYRVDEGELVSHCCGNKDDSGDIDHFTFTVEGQQLWLRVVEGGHSGTTNIGYKVHTSRSCD